MIQMNLLDMKLHFLLDKWDYRSGIKPLEDATKNDPSMFVRHEAAIALGVIGSTDAIKTLQDALNDVDKPVM